jgi:ABC-type sulfate transport system permease component
MPQDPKLLHETYKHLTTLSSASILVMSTFLAKGDMENVKAAYAAIVSLLICNVCCIVLMFGIARGEYPSRDRVTHILAEMLALTSFVTGLGLIAAFGSANFSR